MLRKVLFLGIIASWLFLGTILVSAQTETVVFEKTYHCGSVDVGYYVEPTNDQGYIITGYTQSSLYVWPNLSDIYTIKTNRYGDTIWTRTYYAYDGTFWDKSYCVRQTIDGGYIIAGSVIYSPPWLEGWKRGHLIKTDANGNVVWERIFPEEEIGSCNSVLQTEDGGYIITGWASRPKPNFADVALMKTDANGNPLWAKYFDSHQETEPNEPPSCEGGYWLEKTTDNGFIIAGQRVIRFCPDSVDCSYSYNYKDDWDVYLIKTDGNGDSLWAQTYGSTKCDVGQFVQQTNDGGYIIIGTTLSESSIPVYVIKTNARGDTLWTRTYGEGSKWKTGNGIRQTNDGGYIITGFILPLDETIKKLYLLKINSQGDIEWEQIFDGKGEDACGYSVIQIDNGFAVVGSTANPATGGGDVYLIKTNNEGRITAVSEENSFSPPKSFALFQNYPNPFNPNTTISFDIVKTGEVKLEIYNVLGQRVRVLVDQRVSQGSYTVSWDGRDEKGTLVASGVYFYKLQINREFSQTRRMLLLK